MKQKTFISLLVSMLVLIVPVMNIQAESSNEGVLFNRETLLSVIDRIDRKFESLQAEQNRLVSMLKVAGIYKENPAYTKNGVSSTTDNSYNEQYLASDYDYSDEEAYYEEPEIVTGRVSTPALAYDKNKYSVPDEYFEAAFNGDSRQQKQTLLISRKEEPVDIVSLRNVLLKNKPATKKVIYDSEHKSAAYGQPSRERGRNARVKLAPRNQESFFSAKGLRTKSRVERRLKNTDQITSEPMLVAKPVKIKQRAANFKASYKKKVIKKPIFHAETYNRKVNASRKPKPTPAKRLFDVMFSVQTKREMDSYIGFLNEYGVKDYFAREIKGRFYVYVGTFSQYDYAVKRRREIEDIVGITPSILSRAM